MGGHQHQNKKAEDSKKGHGHADAHKNHGHSKESKPHEGGGSGAAPEEKVNPNLTKRDLKLLEKLHAKIEYLEIRDEHAEANKLREQIDAINDNANAKAAKKAEKKAAGNESKQEKKPIHKKAANAEAAAV